LGSWWFFVGSLRCVSRFVVAAGLLVVVLLSGCPVPVHGLRGRYPPARPTRNFRRSAVALAAYGPALVSAACRCVRYPRLGETSAPRPPAHQPTSPPARRESLSVLWCRWRPAESPAVSAHNLLWTA